MAPQAVAIWLVLLGPVIGSFMTAMADRHCRGVPLLLPRSRCNSCGNGLHAADMVPLWSYVHLKGKCRHCGAAIPRSVWMGELAGLAAAVFVVWLFSDPLYQVLGVAYLWLLIGLFQADAACYRLPDAMTLPMLAVALGLGALQFGLPHALLAAATGFFSLWLLASLYRYFRGREGLGLGDAKLFAGLSAATGLFALPWITLIAALSALIAAVLNERGIKRLRGDTQIAFGCHLAIAGAVVWAVLSASPALRF